MVQATAVRKKIMEKQFSPFYILYGTETFLIEELKQLIVDKAVGQDTRPFNFAQYDMEETPVEVAVEDAETIPFMGEYRVVVIKNPYFLTGKNDKNKVDHNLKRLEQYVEDPSMHSIVIFIAGYEKLDQRKKIVKRLKHSGHMVECSPPGEAAIYDFLRERAGAQGANLTREANERLLQLAGAHLSRLVVELDKMVLYVGEQGTIDARIVDLLCSKTPESNVFALIDRVVQGKLEDAFTVLHDLFKQNEKPIKLLALLARQFRIIYRVKHLKQSGYTQGEIAKRLKLHPYAVKVASGQGKYFEKPVLLEFLNAAAETDFQMKTGKMDQRLALELLLAKIPQIKNSL